MFNKSHKNLTAVFLLIAPILFLGAFTLLQMNFNYPDILRQPAASVMEQFAAGGSGLIANWYVMAFASVLFIPIAVLLHPFLHDEETWYMPLATSFGVIAGVVQALGFVRWPFLVPYLARTYLDPLSSDAAREAVTVTFNAFNQYAGMGIGEHLGYLFTALWSFLVAAAMLHSSRFRPWLAWIGIAASFGILSGTLEPMGVPLVGMINAMAYILWAGWLIITGVFVLRVKVKD